MNMHESIPLVAIAVGRSAGWTERGHGDMAGQALLHLCLITHQAP
jgi:hypothetical protein